MFKRILTGETTYRDVTLVKVYIVAAFIVGAIIGLLGR